MRKIVLILLVLLTCAFAGCASLGFDNEFSKADGLVKERKYPEAIGIYEKIAKDSAGSQRGANGLLSAAKARASQDNPQRDYAGALHHFDEFIRRYPDNKKGPEAQQWRHLLRVIVELKKENERLSENIEQLKKIDIKHEERRRK